MDYAVFATKALHDQILTHAECRDVLADKGRETVHGRDHLNPGMFIMMRSIPLMHRKGRMRPPMP